MKSAYIYTPEERKNISILTKNVCREWRCMISATKEMKTMYWYRHTDFFIDVRWIHYHRAGAFLDLMEDIYHIDVCEMRRRLMNYAMRGDTKDAK